MRPNSKLIKATLTGALSGLIFGVDMVVISGIIDTVVRLYGLNGWEKGMTVAVSPIATVLQLIVVTLFYPETKGQTLEQLQRKLVR
jgi:hypothetical protein